MKTRKEAIDACLSLMGAYEDYPFHDFNWTIMRHEGNKKIFAFITEINGKMQILVKATPQAVEFWISTLESVVPAYHLNKRHWMGILLDDTLPDEQIKQFIFDSYELTKPKIRAKKG